MGLLGGQRSARHQEVSRQQIHLVLLIYQQELDKKCRKLGGQRGARHRGSRPATGTHSVEVLLIYQQELDKWETRRSGEHNISRRLHENTRMLGVTHLSARTGQEMGN
jgi:hypothetical protein